MRKRLDSDLMSGLSSNPPARPNGDVPTPAVTDALHTGSIQLCALNDFDSNSVLSTDPLKGGIATSTDDHSFGRIRTVIPLEEISPGYCLPDNWATQTLFDLNNFNMSVLNDITKLRLTERCL